ncbi:MAG: hypothetical protein DRJ03_31940 [Chloroflexi bacterium]|nr:MAG: hypothetical protein B6I35_03230 [Anaerolineaceae bacterium 4572_32.2]RLC74444.1 MAG: hypothetical protein DRJ03_31940 [Chloroflexota bacterium]RLC82288.1 MAG: hypothetical protein DRI81_00275 [Chloroflexota bacterium]HEY71716.1 STAS/SEC14 domain-containing protein [Thermoflexia bacterium]
MAYELEMRDDGILRMAFIGDMDQQDLEAFRQEFDPFLESATEAEPLRVLVDGSRSGKYTSGARKIFVDLYRSLKIGNVALVAAPRYSRVLVGFVLKATGRDNIHLFDSEEEGLAWLRGES